MRKNVWPTRYIADRHCKALSTTLWQSARRALKVNMITRAI